LTIALFGLWAIKAVDAAEFFCSDVACLIASINKANSLPGEQTIFLEPGTYTLTTVDNDTGDPNGLPSIRRTIEIRQNDQLTTIERDPGAPNFRLFHVAPFGGTSGSMGWGLERLWLAAIEGLDEVHVEGIVERIRTATCPIYISNINAPQQIVAAGRDAALDTMIAQARQQGAHRAERLAVSLPSIAR
jgi:hypothetical protein